MESLLDVLAPAKSFYVDWIAVMDLLLAMYRRLRLASDDRN